MKDATKQPRKYQLQINIEADNLDEMMQRINQMKQMVFDTARAGSRNVIGKGSKSKYSFSWIEWEEQKQTHEL